MGTAISGMAVVMRGNASGPGSTPVTATTACTKRCQLVVEVAALSQAISRSSDGTGSGTGRDGLPGVAKIHTAAATTSSASSTRNVEERNRSLIAAPDLESRLSVPVHC